MKLLLILFIIYILVLEWQYHKSKIKFIEHKKRKAAENE